MVQAALKVVIVCLLFKKLLQNLIAKSNFHPASNSFLGKLVEKMVRLQLQMDLEEVNYLDPFLSDFRPKNSTKMVLTHLLMASNGNSDEVV